MNIKVLAATMATLSLILLLTVGSFFRHGSPGKIDILSSYRLPIANGMYHIDFPIDLETIEAGMYMDGGSYSVTFRDSHGQNHAILIHQPMGEPDKWGDVFYRFGEPLGTEVSCGKDNVLHQIVFTSLHYEHASQQIYIGRTLDLEYPRYIDIAARILGFD